MEKRSYLLANGPAELERLRLQSDLWEPAGAALLRRLRAPAHAHALDVGCGVVGWLRLLKRWVGTDGSVTGIDINPQFLETAQQALATDHAANVHLVVDDLFQTGLEARSFDLVHARFQIAPLGRAEEQMATYMRLCKRGGWLVLEDPDPASWRFHPAAPAAEQLIGLIKAVFAVRGGDFGAGRRLPELMWRAGLEPQISAQIVALAPGHPYLRTCMQLAESLRPDIEGLVGSQALANLLSSASIELDHDRRWGTTFTLVQAFARMS